MALVLRIMRRIGQSSPQEEARTMVVDVCLATANLLSLDQDIHSSVALDLH